MKQDQPSYFAIIPANVRYDKRLPAGAKLMYGEITALSNKNGYCFASNGYFSELYGCTKQAISKWIKLLEKRGYVNINYVENNGVSQRRVSISVDTYQPQLMGVSTQVDHNNTSINKSIVGKPDSAPFHKDVIDYLNASTGSKYRPSTKATKRLVSTRANEGFTLEHFKQVIDTKTAEWKGTPSAKYLRPETLFGTKFESYLNQAASTTVANSDCILNDEQLTDSLQASYNKYIEFVQSECPELYRSECKVLTHSEYRKMAKLVDQPGAFKIPPQARQRLLKKAHIRLNTDEFMRRKYSNVYQLYKEAIRAELNFEKLPI
jgi:uncharacterized phage protein (TIGR02220 family)